MANSSTPPPVARYDRCIDTIHRPAPRIYADACGPWGCGYRCRRPGNPEDDAPVRTLAAVPGRRSVVDYSLQRRAVLADVHAGRTGLFEVCDASPYLTRAAKYHGEATDVACPVCRKERLTLVSYVYGEHLGPTAGQAKTQAELARMDGAQEEFSVYAVQVCRGCGWNHLDCSYVLGAEPDPGRQPRRTRRRAATE